MKRWKTVSLFAVALVSASVIMLVSVSAATADAAQQSRTAGCNNTGGDGVQACWVAEGVSHVTLTPSGQWIYSTNSVVHWTYTRDGVQVGTNLDVAHTTYVEDFTTFTDIVVHHVILSWYRAPDGFRCRGVLNIEITRGELRHSVDSYECTPL